PVGPAQLVKHVINDNILSELNAAESAQSAEVENQLALDFGTEPEPMALGDILDQDWGSLDDLLPPSLASEQDAVAVGTPWESYVELNPLTDMPTEFDLQQYLSAEQFI
ncbi:MAG: hypothetical protein OIF38_06510, partial [Cellvibrionaceae bacterium]|nr:hypothetical protein [Cellvibrionaceae bacterium]